ncbi:Ff.00g006700.m01.CDS01 [Fusarium sp. VM40]|nr:Ff.00g006700.m01.CDS01 [Fusarium sp. VM40]
MAAKRSSTTLVDLGLYKLEMTIRGPPRRAHNPIVVIIPDIGSSVKEWTAVTQGLADSTSVLNYERAGYGQSEIAPQSDSRSVEEIAVELHTLLKTAKVAPPYIVICHSYGGVILQEFIKLRNLAQFKGFVFVNANTGDTPMSFLSPHVQALQQGIDTLDLCYGDCHRLSTSEWDVISKEEARPEHQAAAAREIVGYHAQQDDHCVKKQSGFEKHELGRVPLVVVHADSVVDLGKICTKGLRLGNGTDADRAAMHESIQELKANEGKAQSMLLDLSERSKLQHVGGSGSKAHLTAPESVVDAVIWILMQYRC